MKKILITGSNSYVGDSLKVWLAKQPDQYTVDVMDMIDGAWREQSFAGYDSVVHVAGIAHIKETKQNMELYYKVNRDLAYEVAQKAKSQGVKQFILLSSMSVYGLDEGVIDHNTPLNPKTHYGKSKLQAEKLIVPLGDINFKVAVLRPPMIYGKGCKGNYPKLAKLALKLPFFPYVENQRSMIFIDNLSEFIRLIVIDSEQGIFYPQNTEYFSTSELVDMIAETHGKKIKLTRLFNPLIRVFSSNLGALKKMFGTLVYEKNISYYPNYSPYSSMATIKFTESTSHIREGSNQI